MMSHHTYQITLKPISFFLPSEEVNTNDVQRLAAKIRGNGIWTTPLPVDGATGLVMDGNHRLRAAAMLNLAYLPCVLLNYQNPGLMVLDWQTGMPFDIEHIYRVVVHGKKVLPYKTTRHLFSPALPGTAISLDELRAPVLESAEAC